MLRLVVASSLFAFLLLASGPAESGGAKKNPPNPANPSGISFKEADGQPREFKAGQTSQFAVWHQSGKWHLRTTTANKDHRFNGVIAIEGGRFDGAKSHDLERLADAWILSPDGTQIAFDFKTNRAVDGIDFTVTGNAKSIRFNLLIDGKQHPDRIFVGRDNHHPATDPFRVPAHAKGK